MKRFFPGIVFAVAAIWIGTAFVAAKKSTDGIDLGNFGKIPVLVGGRIKPLDTVARNSLLIIHTKQTLRLDDGRQISAIKWLADTLCMAILRRRGDLYLTDPLTDVQVDGVMFSGGVGEYVYGRETRDLETGGHGEKVMAREPRVHVQSARAQSA